MDGVSPVRIVALAFLAVFVAGPAYACTIVAMPSGDMAQLQQERDNAMIDDAILIYFGRLWSSGGLTRDRYAIRGELTVRGGRAPFYARTSPRYETSCGREPTYSLDGASRILPEQPVIVVARRHSWWRIEIVEVARRDSIRGRQI